MGRNWVCRKLSKIKIKRNKQWKYKNRKINFIEIFQTAGWIKFNFFIFRRKKSISWKWKMQRLSYFSWQVCVLALDLWYKVAKGVSPLMSVAP